MLSYLNSATRFGILISLHRICPINVIKDRNYVCMYVCMYVRTYVRDAMPCLSRLAAYCSKTVRATGLIFSQQGGPVHLLIVLNFRAGRRPGA